MIEENVRQIMSEVPQGVTILAATKTRSVSEILEVVRAGIRVIGENYVQEAWSKFPEIGAVVKWHLIGHLQKNKVKRACRIFDMIETVDSCELALELNKKCRAAERIMPVLIEVNSGAEINKTGVMPDKVKSIAEEIWALENLQLQGLMTMGPEVDNPEKIRPYFKLTANIFEELKDVYGGKIEFLSMGMSDTWRIAVQEGANIVRIGTGIFGARKTKK